MNQSGGRVTALIEAFEQRIHENENEDQQVSSIDSDRRKEETDLKSTGENDSIEVPRKAYEVSTVETIKFVDISDTNTITSITTSGSPSSPISWASSSPPSPSSSSSPPPRPPPQMSSRVSRALPPKYQQRQRYSRQQSTAHSVKTTNASTNHNTRKKLFTFKNNNNNNQDETLNVTNVTMPRQRRSTHCIIPTHKLRDYTRTLTAQNAELRALRDKLLHMSSERNLPVKDTPSTSSSVSASTTSPSSSSSSDLQA